MRLLSWLLIHLMNTKFQDRVQPSIHRGSHPRYLLSFHDMVKMRDQGEVLGGQIPPPLRMGAPCVVGQSRTACDGFVSEKVEKSKCVDVQISSDIH